MSARHPQKYNASPIVAAPHTGALLLEYLKKERLHKSAIARAMGRRHTTLVGYYKRPSIQTAILWELCHVLKHNFFADIAAQVPAAYPSSVPQDDSAALRIAALEEELRAVTRERDVLERVLSARG